MKRQRPQGFTLIEVVVILAIIIIIASLTTIDFRASGTRTAGKFGSEIYISDIRATANRARAGERFQGKTPTGWGILSNSAKNAYTIFADLDGDYTYDNNEKYSEVVLQVKSISASQTGTGIVRDIFFANGTGKLHVNGDPVEPGGNDVVISLRDADNELIRSFSVNWLGTISPQ